MSAWSTDARWLATWATLAMRSIERPGRRVSVIVKAVHGGWAAEVRPA
jgi:hypothetical protein